MRPQASDPISCLVTFLMLVSACIAIYAVVMIVVALIHSGK